MSGTEDCRTIAVEANGLVLELVMQPAALALEPGIGDTISSSILTANEIAGPVRGVVTVLVDDDTRVRALNKLWRDIDKPTNVLSFPYPEGPSGPDRCIGDIAISYETAASEAAADGLPLAHHLAHLSVHGFLHLLGYDHESDRDAEAMERLERDILARLDVPDPYLAREAKG